MPAVTVTTLESKSFNEPDEKRRPPKTEVDVVNIGGTTPGRFTFEPGWRWSETVRPWSTPTAARTTVWASAPPAHSPFSWKTGPAPQSTPVTPMPSLRATMRGLKRRDVRGVRNHECGHVRQVRLID